MALPIGYSVTKLRHIDPKKWYALDLRKPHKPHVLPLSMNTFHLAKRWLISQKFYLDNQVQLIKGSKVLEMGLFINWNNLPQLALPHKYPGHLGFGKNRKDWKESIRKELKAAETGWQRIRQYTFYYFGNHYVIYSWDAEKFYHVKRILKSVFPPKHIKTILSKLREGPKQIKKSTKWLSGLQRNPSPIMINRFNQEHGLKPLNRFPHHGNIALRWRGFIEEYAPLPDKYLQSIH